MSEPWRNATALTFAGAAVAFDLLAMAPNMPNRPLDVTIAVSCALTAILIMLWPASDYRQLLARPNPHPDPTAVAGVTWLALRTAREVMLAAQTSARDQWAVVSRAHLGRIRPGTVGVIVYDPGTHRVVMIARGVTAYPIKPRPLADFGLKAPHPIHYLRASEVPQARGVALTSKGSYA